MAKVLSFPGFRGCISVKKNGENTQYFSFVMYKIHTGGYRKRLYHVVILYSHLNLYIVIQKHVICICQPSTFIYPCMILCLVSGGNSRLSLALWLQPLVLQLQLFKAEAAGLGGVSQCVEAFHFD